MSIPQPESTDTRGNIPDMPFFTIIMPTYNQGSFIQTALESILNQQADLELLVYDAVSTDETPKILERYKDRLTWIREKDNGMTDAINKGIHAARGEVIAWLNSDDVYLPHTLQRVQDAFTRKASLDFAYGDALEIRRDGTYIAPNVFTEDCRATRYLYSHNYMCQPTVFFHQRVPEKLGLLREDLRWTMDYEWFARFYLENMQGLRLPYFLAANRDYADTLTNSGGRARYREMMSIHRIRPGRPMPLRRAYWIYTLEALIKGANGKRDTLPASSLRARMLQKFSQQAGAYFVKMVNPQSRNDIVKRFQQNILPHGDSVQALWDDAGQTQPAEVRT